MEDRRCRMCQKPRAAEALGACLDCVRSSVCPCFVPHVIHEAPSVCQWCGKPSRLPPVTETRVGDVVRLAAQFKACGFDGWQVAIQGKPGDSPTLLLPTAPLDREAWRAVVSTVDALFEVWERKK